MLSANKNSSRNLLIRSVAFDSINKSLVLPAQEFKDIQQEIANARKLKIGPSTVSKHTRQNPDSSTGLCLTSELRAKARIVSNNKKKHDAEEVRKKIITTNNKMLLQSKRHAAFERVKSSVKCKHYDLHLGIASHSSGDDIKAAYLYCGGKASNLKDAKRSTFENAIIAQFALRLTEDDGIDVAEVFNDTDVVCDDIIQLNAGINIPNKTDEVEIGTTEEI